MQPPPPEMATDASDRPMATALALMRMALPLLDRAGQTLAAVHLQQALEAASAPRDGGAAERDDRSMLPARER